MNGVTSFLFQSIPARSGALDQAAFADLLALWFVVFTVAPGIFLPLEQEAGRLLGTRRAHGEGGRSVIERAAVLGALMSGVLCLATLALGPWLLDNFFGSDVLLLAALVAGIPIYATFFLVRGALAGGRAFRSYGWLLAIDGVLRVAMCIGLVVAGVDEPGPYGLALVLASLVTVTGIAWKERDLLLPGPEQPWHDLTKALGFLLVGQLLAQALFNAPPLAINLLVDDAERGDAGKFNSAFLIARLPLYLFAAVQAALLPKLSHLVAAGRIAEFVIGMRRLLMAILGITVLGVGGAFLLGPFAIKTLFGDDYEMSRVSITLLCGASCILMAAIAFAQGLIAVERIRLVALAWGAGLVAFILVVATGEGSELRAEVGYVVGAVVSAALNGFFLVRHLHDVHPTPSDDLPIVEILVEP